MDNIFGAENYLQQAIWKRHAGGGNDSKFFAVDHEYLTVYSKNRKDLGSLRMPLTAEDKAKFAEKDENFDLLGPYKVKSFRRMRPDDPRKNLQYEIKMPDGTLLKDEWKWEESNFLEAQQKNKVQIRKDNKGKWQVEYKLYLYEDTNDDEQEEKTKVPRSLLADLEKNSEGKKQLKNLFNKEVFTNPKPIGLVSFTISTCTPLEDEIILDYFAGSGTTGHAVLDINRLYGGTRKYILIEMGEYFDTVTKARIQKVVYSKDWKEGKPLSREGISHCFKYMKLESYEDTLNNLALNRNETQQHALEINPSFKEGYMLNYMLDVETQGSLLNLEWFINPFNCFLNVTRNNELQPTKVDLIETFNYLIGLVVENYAAPKDGYVVVTGKNLAGESILVVWRDCTQHNNEELNKFLEKSKYNPLDTEYDRIYVNGDNNVENLKTGEERWKVILIEEEFKKRMFENI
jgi:adenine-specific DNA-methyltransferase